MVSLKQILTGEKDITLIGSSFGGLMATIFAMENAEKVARLILLAPALNFPEFSRYTIQRLTTPTWMIIGKDDIVTPPADVVPIADKIFTELHYEEVNDDHILARTFRGLDWHSMLEDK
jgi:pimeloyl-ACP methyl ester carboxylesterase